jgi:restriction system protein
MAIPDFQTAMRPLLEMLADGQEHSNAELYQRIAQHFQLSEEEQETLLPRGRQPVLHNRVGWALSHCKVAGVVESPRRGVYQITSRGQEILQANPERVDLKVLDQFPEHVAFRTPKKAELQRTPSVNGQQAPDVALTVDTATPDEAISLAYQELRSSLAQELLEKIKQSSPAFFERLVVDVLLAMGYGGSQRDAGEALGRSGDGGLDGVIREDKLGLDVIYLQAKRWEGSVGRPVIQAFVGALHGAQATKGVIITTSDFTADARTYVKTIPTRIVLVDGKTLAELMMDHNVAVSRVSNYEIKKIDSDYFSEL